MDGRQRTINHSLQRDLNRWIMLSTLLFAIVVGVFSGLLAFHEAREMQDNMLHDIAALVRKSQLSGTPPLVKGIGKKGVIREDTIIIQRIDGENIETPISFGDYADGIYTVQSGDDEWRVLIQTVPAKNQHRDWRFAIAQQTEERDEVAWQNTLSALLPILLLTVFILSLVNFIIRDRFKPLRSLATLVNQRDETNLNPFPDNNIPDEITPFLQSINHLLSRVRRILLQQQRFITDAAHELGSPVAALSLLADNVDRAPTPEERSKRQTLLQEGIMRLGTLISQLLDLASIQADRCRPAVPVSLNRLVRETIARVYPLAEEKTIDIGILREEPLTVLDANAMLGRLVCNAIDNAIRYSPPGGKVDICLFTHEDKAVLLVEDSGPGIPEKDIPQVSKAFYRTQDTLESGTGLGLAICQEIAKILGGEIILKNSDRGSLQFIYQQPLAGK